MTRGAVDTNIAKLKEIAERLQRGEITLAQAEEEGKRVQASFIRDVAAAATSKTAAPRNSSVWITLLLLCCVIGGVFLARG